MWRFLHNIPRALKNYHGPRASIGVYVESDDKEQDSCSVKRDHKESQKCIDQRKEKACCVYNRGPSTKDQTILWRLVSQRNQSHSSGDQNGANQDDQDWWNSCQQDLLAFLQSSNRIFEAFAVGSSFIWGPNFKRRNQKSDLVYRVLFSISDKDEIVRINGAKDSLSNELPRLKGQTLLAIKDAAGSAHDREINHLKCETLETALKEFEHMCTDYTAQNESLLALMALDNGEKAEAVEHFRTACSMGNKTACFNLGLCYERGKGVCKDLEKAKHYYELAALKGHCQAMYNLSLLYFNDVESEHSLAENNEKGIYYMDMAARSGLVEAQNYMGVYYMQEMDEAKRAVAYFKAAASQNDSEGQYLLALCNEHGLGVEVNECWAAHLYSLAAGMGHDEAILNLARFHENGLGGIPVDKETASKLYNKAAELGNEEAKHHLQEIEASKNNQTFSLNQTEDTQILQSCYNCNRTTSLSSSSSSPSLRQMADSVSEAFYQQLYTLFQKMDERCTTLLDPGGDGVDERVKFYFSEGEGNLNNCDMDTHVNEKTEKPTLSLFDHYNESHHSSSLHRFNKSNTSPDLASMIAYNV